MKKQILTLIIGILIGAIITVGIFMLQRGNGDMKRGGDMGEPPTMDGNMTERPRGNGRGNDVNDVITENNNNETNT